MPILRGDIPDQQSLSTGAAEKTKASTPRSGGNSVEGNPTRDFGSLWETSTKLKARNPKSAVC
jgi:hypothetical protein